MCSCRARRSRATKSRQLHTDRFASVWPSMMRRRSGALCAISTFRHFGGDPFKRTRLFEINHPPRAAQSTWCRQSVYGWFDHPTSGVRGSGHVGRSENARGALSHCASRAARLRVVEMHVEGRRIRTGFSSSMRGENDARTASGVGSSASGASARSGIASFAVPAPARTRTASGSAHGSAGVRAASVRPSAATECAGIAPAARRTAGASRVVV